MKQQVNLYKPEFRPARLLFSFTHIAMVWVLATLSCLLVSWALLSKIEDEQLSLLIAQQTEMRMNQQIEKLDVILSQKTRDESLNQRNEQLKATLARGADLLQAVKAGENGWSNSTSMADIFEGLARQTLNGISLDEIHISEGPELTILGNASRPEQVPEYLKKLGKEAVFSGMHFEDLKLNLVEDTQSIDFRFASKRNSSTEPGK